MVRTAQAVKELTTNEIKTSHVRQGDKTCRIIIQPILLLMIQLLFGRIRCQCPSLSRNHFGVVEKSDLWNLHGAGAEKLLRVKVLRFPGRAFQNT